MSEGVRSRGFEIQCVCGHWIGVFDGRAIGPVRCARCGAELLLDEATDLPGDVGHGAAPTHIEPRTRCDACGAPLDLAGAEQRGEAFVVCAYCGVQFDRNDSQVVEWGEFVPSSAEMIRLEVPLADGAPQLWEMDGKRFKTQDALERHVRSQYPMAVADEIIKALRDRRT